MAHAYDIMPVGNSLSPAEHLAEIEMPVKLTEPLGTETLLFAELAGGEVQAKMLNPHPVEMGERMRFRVSLDKCQLFDCETGMAFKA